MLFLFFLTIFFHSSLSAVYTVQHRWTNTQWTCLRFIPETITVNVGDQISYQVLSGTDAIVFQSTPYNIPIFDENPLLPILENNADQRVMFPRRSLILDVNVSTTTGQSSVSSGAVGAGGQPFFRPASPAVTPSPFSAFTFNQAGVYTGYSATNPWATLTVTVVGSGAPLPATVDTDAANYIATLPTLATGFETTNALTSTTDIKTFRNATQSNVFTINVGWGDFATGLYFNKFWPNSGNAQILQRDSVKFVPSTFGGKHIHHSILFNTSGTFDYPVLFFPGVGFLTGADYINILLHFPMGNPRNYSSGVLGSGLFNVETWDDFEVTFYNTGIFFYNDGFNQISSSIGVSPNPVSFTPSIEWTREYRSFDGIYNNIDNPFWGSVHQPHGRQLTNGEYFFSSATVNPAWGVQDDIGATRPNMRTLSNRMAVAGNKGHDVAPNLISVLHTEFSQFMIADMADTHIAAGPPPLTGVGPIGVPCIDSDDYWISSGDFNWRRGFGSPFYNATQFQEAYGYTAVNLKPHETDGRFLINVWRLHPAVSDNYVQIPLGGPNTGINLQTVYFDLSIVYGRYKHDVNKFWDHSTGKMLFVEVPGLFVSTFPFPDRSFAVGGDYRINKVPGLRAMWDLFKNNHNTIVSSFNTSAHADWTPYMKYQEARRMNIAVWQSLVMREYLASTTGSPNPAYAGYNPSVRAQIDHAFTHAVGRYGHSMVTTIQERVDNTGFPCVGGYFMTAATIYNPSKWKFSVKGAAPAYDWDCSWRGWANSISAKFDLGVVDDLRNLLFQSTNRAGEDLLTYNIARGRDSGVVNYNRLRELMGLARKASFSEISSDPNVVAMLSSTYASVDVIDPLVGAMAEDIAASSSLGELTNAVVRAQFKNLRDGDRFFFENTDYFTPAEIEAIHGIKLQKLILTNYPNIAATAIPSNAFYVSKRQLGVTGAGDTFFPELVPLATDLPWTTLDVSPGLYRMSWAIARNETVYFKLQVKNSGYVGLGFRENVPQLNTMKGADIIWCRIEVNGTPMCHDTKALDVGDLYFEGPYLPPDVPSTVQGGGKKRNHHSNDVTLIDYSQVDGLTQVTFSRPMRTGDTYDNDISDNRNIIFSFHPTSHEYTYHGPTRSAAFTINFISDYKGPYIKQNQELWILIVLYIWSSIGIIMSLIIAFLVILKRPYFVFQTPEFCLIILFGSILCYVSVILLLPDQLTNGMCYAHLWLFGMGFWAIYGGIMLKNFRVFWVFTNAEKMRIKRITWIDILPPLFIFFLLECAFNIVWDAVTAVQPNLDVFRFDATRTYVEYCAGNKWFWLGSVLFRVALLIVSAILAYLSKGLKKEQNYSKETALAIYTTAIILVVAVPIGFALTQSPTLVVLLKGIAICMGVMMTVIITFFDPVYRIFSGKGERKFQSTVTGLTGGASGSGDSVKSHSVNTASVMTMKDM